MLKHKFMISVLQIVSGVSYEEAHMLKERWKKENIIHFFLIGYQNSNFPFEVYVVLKTMHINLKCGIKRVAQFSCSSMSIMDAPHYKKKKNLYCH